MKTKLKDMTVFKMIDSIEGDDYSLKALRDSLIKSYPPERLDAIRHGEGAELRKFIGWYHKIATRLGEVPPHWLTFVGDIMKDAARLTESSPKAREGLLAKEMGLQGGFTMKSRDESLCLIIQQHINTGYKVGEAKDETLKIAEEHGWWLSDIDKIWIKRDKEVIDALIEEQPEYEFFTLEVNWGRK